MRRRYRSECFRVGEPASVQPRAIVESEAVDDQRVAVPPSDGVPHPRAFGIGFQLAAVHENETVREGFVGDHDD